MARIGLKSLTYATISTGGEGSAVVYTGGVTKGDMMIRADDTLNHEDVKLFADNHTVERANGVVGGQIALELAEGDEDDLRAIHALGEGWVGDEAMAIALFCAVRHESDFARGVKAENKRNERLSAVYWCTVTAGFLAYSFITEDWQHSWVVWPVAGVLYGVVLAVAAAVRKKEKE